MVTVIATFTSDRGTPYEVREGKDGVVYCTCPAWRFSGKVRGSEGFGGGKARKDCKHLQRLRGMVNGSDEGERVRRMEMKAAEEGEQPAQSLTGPVTPAAYPSLPEPSTVEGVLDKMAGYF